MNIKKWLSPPIDDRIVLKMIDLLRKFTLEYDIDNLSEENELLNYLLQHNYETLITNFQVLVTL